MGKFSSIFQDYWVTSVNKPENHLNIAFEISSMISTLEKVFTVCLLQCLNSLLYTIIVLPIKCLKNPTTQDLLRLVILLGVSFQGAFTMPISRLFHDLKEQDFLKLNFVYNIIGIADQLLMAFGYKCLKQFGNSFENYLISIVYVWLHTLHLTLAVTVFEVALNSSRYNLLLVVISAAVVEIKITVFKKHDRKSLSNVIYNDVVERLQLLLYLFVILVKNYALNRGNIEEISKGMIIILMTAFIIDWIKHYFVMLFNNIPLDTYTKVYTEMKDNWVSVYETGEFVDNDVKTQIIIDPSCSLTLNYKFMALPQACMLLRSLTTILSQLSILQITSSYICATVFKLLINCYLLIFIN